MPDLFYLSFGLAGFALAALAVRAIDRMWFMTFDIVLGLAVSAGIFGFSVLALIRPNRFKVCKMAALSCGMENPLGRI